MSKKTDEAVDMVYAWIGVWIAAEVIGMIVGLVLYCALSR